MQLVQPHCHRYGDGQHGLQVGVDARNGRLHRFERIVEHQVGQIGRDDQHEQGREERMLRDCGVVGVDDRPQSERQRDDRGGAIEPAQDGRDSVFGDQPFEPDHVERRNAGAEQNQDVAPQVRMGVGGRDARQYDGDGSRHAERETGDFEFREAIHSQQHRDDQHEQRNDRVDDRSVDGRRHRESVHDEDLAQHADEQCGPDQSADVGARHLFGFLPGERNE